MWVAVSVSSIFMNRAVTSFSTWMFDDLILAPDITVVFWTRIVLFAKISPYTERADVVIAVVLSASPTMLPLTDKRSAVRTLTVNK